MGGRIQPRRGNGRFRRASLAQDFGLNCLVCDDCRRLNPYPVGSEKPTSCHACGSENLT